MKYPYPPLYGLTVDEYERGRLLIDNAAVASQNSDLIDDHVTNEAIWLNLIVPLMRPKDAQT